MQTLNINGEMLHVEDKVFEIYTKVKTDRTFAKEIKMNFSKAVSPYKLTAKEMTQLKKVLP